MKVKFWVDLRVSSRLCVLLSHNRVTISKGLSLKSCSDSYPTPRGEFKSVILNSKLHFYVAYKQRKTRNI